MESLSECVLGIHGPTPLYISLTLAITCLAIIEAATTPIQQLTFTSDMTNQQQIAHLSKIIEALEDLGVLESTHTKCYSLDKITTVREQLNRHSAKISIDFHVQELGNSNKLSGIEGSRKGSDWNNGPSEGLQTVGGCMSLPPYSAPSTTVLQNDSFPANHTEALVTDSLATKHEEGGLRLAQIMVISTCSTVIGLFFIVAMTMRIRNCIKRRRHKRKTRRTAFHSSEINVDSSHDTCNDAHQTSDISFVRYHRAKAPRSHGYKLGSSSMGFSLFYAPDSGANGFY